MEQKNESHVDLDDLKRHRKIFKEQLEEDDYGLQIRIQKAMDDYELIGSQPTRLGMLLEESVHQLRMQRQQLWDLGSDHLYQMDKKIRLLEEEQDEKRREKK